MHNEFAMIIIEYRAFDLTLFDDKKEREKKEMGPRKVV